MIRIDKKLDDLIHKVYAMHDSDSDFESVLQQMAVMLTLDFMVFASWDKQNKHYIVASKQAEEIPDEIQRWLQLNTHLIKTDSNTTKKPRNSGDVVSSIIENSPQPDSTSVLLGLQTQTTQRSANEIQSVLGYLHQHIVRFLQVQQSLENKQTEIQAIIRMINKVAFGVVLLDQRGCIQFVNLCGRTMMNNHPAIDVKSNRLKVHEKVHQDALEKAIRLQNKQQSGLEGRKSLLHFYHPEREYPLIAMLMPASASTFSGFSVNKDVSCVVLLKDPAEQYTNITRHFQEYYALTDAEIRVAIHISNGLSLQQISEQHTVTINTLRVQLKSIFRKTGTNSQAGLVSFMLRDPLMNFA